MDHVAVLKRAFQQTLRHKAMWLFGFLLVLTGAGGGNGGGNIQLSAQGAGTPGFGLPGAAVATLAAGVILLALLVGLVMAVVRYVAEAGLLGMTREAEVQGSTSVGQGFRFGWSRSAWRLFLIDLLVGVPTAIVIVCLVALALSPLLLLLAEANALKVLGVALAVGMGLLVLGVIIVVAVVLSVLRQFFIRRCTLEGEGVVDSVREGFQFVGSHLKDVAVMWLLMLGIGILWGFVILALVLLLGALTGVVGGIPAYLVGQALESWLAGAAILVPVGIVLFLLPMAFVGTLYLTFQYNVWTLTYLELARAEETTSPG